MSATGGSARATLEGEWSMVRDWIARLPAGALDEASALDGWTVRDLVAHLGRAIGMLAVVEPADDATPVTIAGYVNGYAPAASAIAEGTRELARERGDDLDALLDESWSAALASMDAWGSDGRRVLRGPRGPIRQDDMIATRTLEVVVHGDDLARSLPDLEPPAHTREALREVVKLLLSVLIERAPGHTVEVRVPPFAAVQCIEGASHTRGTPPNTVETDALTWIRVACGRVPWAAAIHDGSLLASGNRADAVAGLLPLL